MRLVSLLGGFLIKCASIAVILTAFCLTFHSTSSFASDFSASLIGDYGNVTVMEVTGNYDADLPDGTFNQEPRQLIAQEFFRTHKDAYDFLVFFSNFDYAMSSAETAGFYTSVKNDVQGIGQGLFD